MTDSLSTQVGGAHYKGLAIQPMKFSITNSWDAAAHTALKYITRFREKAGKEDLQKALHCIELRRDLHGHTPHRDKLAQYLFHAGDVHSLLQQRGQLRMRMVPDIPMARYIAENGLDGLQAEALFHLEKWVNEGCELSHLETVFAVEALIDEEYPDA